MPRRSLRPLTSALVDEHAFLRRALGVFARYAGRIASGEPYDPRLAGHFLRFFREFSEARHGQEEEQLFVSLEAKGWPRAFGPLVVLRAEHALGRDLFRALSTAQKALQRAPDKSALRLHFHGLALHYVELALAHMQKEELVVFPLAAQLEREGVQVPRMRRMSARKVAWVRSMEVRANGWPPIRLSLYGHGTLSAFRRLCAESLPSSTPARPHRASRRPRAS